VPSSDSQIRPDETTTDVVGERVGAQIIDTIALFVQLVVVAFALGVLARPSSEGAVRGLVFLGVFTLPLYGGLLEAYWNGQTLGKRVMGIKVVDDRGAEPTVGQALTRNIPALVLFSWLTTAVALVAVATDDRRQRLFDRAAATYVVDASVGTRDRRATDADAGSGPMGSPNSRPRR
jgi:uncharacterized RDD family membrane protein YckC